VGEADGAEGEVDADGKGDARADGDEGTADDTGGDEGTAGDPDDDGVELLLTLGMMAEPDRYVAARRAVICACNPLVFQASPG
jgi:hypothetical protein